MKGKLYGIGVGPGDPELMTLKAVRILKECPVIAVPISGSTAGEAVAYKIAREAVAYQIAREALPEIEGKTKLEIQMPMTRDHALLDASHQEAAKQLIRVLDQGKDAAFLTLGDPTVYSTYMYVHRLVAEAGYEAEIVSGIPSFCAAAARLGIALAERQEPIHIYPAAYGVSEALKLPGTKVLMKAGKKLAQLSEKLEDGQQAYVIENCGMPGERVWKREPENRPPVPAGYFTTVIVKGRDSR